MKLQPGAPLFFFLGAGACPLQVLERLFACRLRLARLRLRPYQARAQLLGLAPIAALQRRRLTSGLLDLQAGLLCRDLGLARCRLGLLQLGLGGLTCRLLFLGLFDQLISFCLELGRLGRRLLELRRGLLLIACAGLSPRQLFQRRLARGLRLAGCRGLPGQLGPGLRCLQVTLGLLCPGLLVGGACIRPHALQLGFGPRELGPGSGGLSS